MNVVDNYLDCLNEGKVWDKTKEYAKKAGSFVNKHKGKIAAGVALGAAAYGGKKLLTKTPEQKAAIDKENKIKQAAEKKNKDAAVKRINAKNAKAADRKNFVGAVASAVGKAAEVGTRPARWATGKVASLAGKGVKAAASGTKNYMVQSLKNKRDELKYKDSINKKAKQPGVIGAAIQGWKAK